MGVETTRVGLIGCGRVAGRQPRPPISWANLFLDYGPWIEPHTFGLNCAESEGDILFSDLSISALMIGTS